MGSGSAGTVPACPHVMPSNWLEDRDKQETLLIPATGIQMGHPFSSQTGITRVTAPVCTNKNSRRGRDLGTEMCMYHIVHKGHGLAWSYSTATERALIQIKGGRNMDQGSTSSSPRPRGKSDTLGKGQEWGRSMYLGTAIASVPSQPWVPGKVTHTRGKAEILMDGKQNHS